MSENNLDKLFQEKLANFQEIPDEKVWNSIAVSLDKKKQSRKIFPIWWKVGGVAAILTILFFAIDPFSTSKSEQPIITDVENKSPNTQELDKVLKSSEESTTITATKNVPIEQSAIEITSQKGKENLNSLQKTEGRTVATTNNKNSNPVKNQNALKTDKAVTLNTIQKEQSSLPLNKEIVVAANNQKNSMKLAQKLPLMGKEEEKITDQGINISKNQDKTIPVNEASTEKEPFKKKSILDEIEEEDDLAVEGPRNGKWSAGPNIAPVYFNGIGEGSPINSILATNSKTGNVTLSYGITVAYEISKKLSVRSGINKVDFGYDTNDVSFTSSFNASSGKQLNNLDYSNTSQSIILNDSRAENAIPKPRSQFATDVTGKNPTRFGTMGQQIGYLEVPLELNYALLNRKFGVNIIGGVSSLFLTDNSVVLESNGQTTEVGEANNINSVNFSTNIGLGLNYKFTRKLKFNVEPVFKYQLNTFSNTSGSFNPYSLGVYSGFSFKF